MFPQSTFTIIDFILEFSYLFIHRSFVYLLIHSVQLMSIMDHYSYATRPLVEYNLDLYTERASFLGWLGHMSERRRLAITLDPASSEPTRFKNKRVQASENYTSVRGESETEVTPVTRPSSTKPSTARSANPHSFSPQAPRQTQETRVAARAAKEGKRLILMMTTSLLLNWKRPNQKGLLPREVPLGLKLPPLSPTPVPLALSLMRVESVPNISMKKNRKLQILTLP